jgi:hypothetical protein
MISTEKNLINILCVLQLAREAVQVKTATPHMVIGNQIITNVSVFICLNFSCLIFLV